MGSGAARRVIRVPILAVLLLTPLLAGCDSTAEEQASTETDVRRAEGVWRDPWLAPADLGVPTHGYGSNGYVGRYAGQRQYVAGGSPTDAAATEVRAALDDGWELITATCSPRRTLAQLVRGSDLDDAALGAVVTRPDGRDVEVVVVAQVPHHADGSWPPSDAPTLELADSCLGGADGRHPLLELPGPPTDGEGEPGPEDFDGWQRDEWTDDETALLADLVDDPWVQATVPDPATRLAPRDDLRTGDSNRFGVYASGELPSATRDPRAAVAAVVATMTEWEPTWAACTRGRDGVVDVRLRRVTDAGVATVRLLRDASSSDVQWQLNTPLPEGPDPGWVADPSALDEPRCLSAAPLPDGLTVEGEPVSLPTQLQPVP